MRYPFRTTYRQDNDTYIEDRGYPHAVTRGDADFPALEAEFGELLAVGQTATRANGDDGWAVEDGSPLLEATRARALDALRTAWLTVEANGTVASAAGFVIDATERANRDIEGLITVMEMTNTPSTMFCAADDSFHEVTLAQLKTMRLEIIQRGQALYARKWALRAAIEQARTFEELNAVAIGFEDI